MGAWGYALMVLLPVPVTFLILLSAPIPHSVQKLVIRFCSSVLALPALGVFTVFHIGTFVAACTFAAALWSTYHGGLVQAHSVYQSVKFRDGLSPNEKIQMLADKWRNERNFWISAMCFLLWVVLARFYSICKKNLAMRDQISRLQGDPGPEGFGHIPEPLPDSATGGKASTSGVVKKRPVAKKTT